MDSLTKADLRALIQRRDGAYVSIFQPAHRAGPDTQQDPIVLKNLLTEAEQDLASYGLRQLEIKHLLEPAHRLLEDTYYWQNQSDGLALFLSDSDFFAYRLPIDFAPLAVVSDRFHIKPLLSFFCDDGRFYVLALSQDEVRLLRGTHYSVDEVRLDRVPSSLEEALKYDDPERQLQLHTSTVGLVGAGHNRASRGGPEAIFHGHGSDSADVHKEHILRYFHHIDAGLSEVLAGETAPMVLAGVGFLHALYREANSYGHLLEEGIFCNPEHISADDLRDQAWDVVGPVFAMRREQAAEQYRELAATGSARAVSAVEEVVPSAYVGRVETLFVVLGTQVWGRFDPEANVVQRHDEAAPGDEDLLDVAAVQALLHDGTVFAVEAQDIPGGKELAAVLRY
jgi:hypothetical protein